MDARVRFVQRRIGGWTWQSKSADPKVKERVKRLSNIVRKNECRSKIVVINASCCRMKGDPWAKNAASCPLNGDCEQGDDLGNTMYVHIFELSNMMITGPGVPLVLRLELGCRRIWLSVADNARRRILNASTTALHLELGTLFLTGVHERVGGSGSLCKIHVFGQCPSHSISICPRCITHLRYKRSFPVFLVTYTVMYGIWQLWRGLVAHSKNQRWIDSGRSWTIYQL